MDTGTNLMDDVEPRKSTGNEQPTKDSKQRFKPQLSCTLCRNRKLKCDRQLPCSNCSKRGLSATCTFVNNAPRGRPASVQKASRPTKDFESQIKHLESLVVSMMNRANQIDNRSSTNSSGLTPESYNSSTYESSSDNQLHTRPTSEPDLGTSADTFGRISIKDNQSSYVGHSHWTAILDNIAGLRDSLDIKETSPQPLTPPESTPRGPDLLVGSLPKASRADIIASLPARPVVEALVEGYLSIPDLCNHVIHQATFRREVKSFWADPKKAPTSWIGLLYSIMCAAVFFQDINGTDLLRSFEDQVMLDEADFVDLFRQKTAQCLVLSNYTEPDQYTVPTMINYFIIEHLRSPDGQFGNWMMMGMIIRAALRLGLHRDPSHQPNLSPLRGEMNRRVWDILVYFDSQTSLQVGLPRMIHEDSYDTKLPSNLYDEDFDESTTILPPSRPDHEITPMGYANSKHGLSGILGRIIDLSNSTTVIPYHEVMILDSQIHAAKSRVPAALTISQADELQTGDYESIFRRFTIHITFQKSRCVLHRKYLFPNQNTNTYPYPYSVKACVDASMRILQSQMIMYNETLPGGRMHAHRWHASSLLTHDFLLAAMLICLYVSNSLNLTTSDKEVESGIKVQWSREEMLSLLESSYGIWNDLEKVSKEAAQAARGLRIMLKRVKEAKALRNNLSITPANEVARSSISFSAPEYPEQTGTASPGTWLSQNSLDHGSTQLQPQGTTPSQQIDFDWELWDTHFQPINPILTETPPELWNLLFEPSATGNVADPNLNTSPGGNGFGNW